MEANRSSQGLARATPLPIAQGKDRRLVLFGSVLPGEAGADNAVDLLVQFSPGAKTCDRLLDLSDLLEERLGWRVELVTMEAVSPFPGPRILAEAQDVLRAA